MHLSAARSLLFLVCSQQVRLARDQAGRYDTLDFVAGGQLSARLAQKQAVLSAKELYPL